MAKSELHMTRILCSIAFVAAAALAGCDNTDHNIVAEGPYDPQANLTANSGPVELPPAIVSSKTYRCKDNSLVRIDWLSDGKSANLRGEQQAGEPTHLKAEEAGKPLVAEGYSLTGDPKAASITLTRPGAGSQTCNA